jgi:Flp pilus assembly pilin Flp
VRPQGEEGATASEYALMAGLIAVVIAVAVTAFGIAVDGTFLSLTSQWP